jgi:hypothetical protein
MSEPARPPATELPVAADLQREVQRLLGRCLLRFQQYERLLKAVLATQEISGTIDTAPARQAERVEDLRTLTLGTLVKEFLGTYVTREGEDAAEPRNLEQEALDSGKVVFRYRMTMQMSDERIAETKDALRELVALRNELVHHLIERFDVWTVVGCVAAKEHLAQSYSLIDARFEELRGWAETADNARAMSASFMQFEVYQDLVINGVASDGSVEWGAAGIVRVLREALSALQVDGWASLDAAVTSISQHHPEQTPAKYRCGSWGHVLSESGVFQLQYRQEEDGRKMGWYRLRPNSR